MVKLKVKKMKDELEELHSWEYTAAAEERIYEVKEELEEQLDREELLWKQISKAQWLAKGDRNTRFLH